MKFDTEGYCCIGFKAAFESRREKGLHAWAVESPDSGELHFRIGWQCVDAGRESDFLTLLAGQKSDLCISTSGCTGLVFCPWCESNLERHYRKRRHLVLDNELGQKWEPQNQPSQPIAGKPGSG